MKNICIAIIAIRIFVKIENVIIGKNGAQMIISEKQLLFLIAILRDTLGVIEIDKTFSISRENRRALYQDIVNQQSEELREVE